jgi:broad specificity phosphatase PhoE
MILTFMRHPPIDAESERCIGQTDVELSAEGRAALVSLAEEGCRFRPDKILCSDLKRCQMLADAIAARLGLLPEPDPIWREVNFGTWENRTWSDIRNSEPQIFGEWTANFDTVAPPGGESFEDLQARVLKGVERKIIEPKRDRGVTAVALRDPGVPPVRRFGANTGQAPMSRLGQITGETPGSHCLVITHAGVIRAAVSAFSGSPLRNAFELAVPYGSHSTFRKDGNRWSPFDLVTGRRIPSREGAP